MEKYEINKYLEKFHNSVNDLNLALDSVSLEKKLKELNEKLINNYQDERKFLDYNSIYNRAPPAGTRRCTPCAPHRAVR